MATDLLREWLDFYTLKMDGAVAIPVRSKHLIMNSIFR